MLNIWRMCRQCIPGSVFSAYEKEPGDEASVDTTVLCGWVGDCVDGSCIYMIYCLQFPMTALREIRVLQQLKHENVVNLVEVCRGKREN